MWGDALAPEDDRVRQVEQQQQRQPQRQFNQYSSLPQSQFHQNQPPVPPSFHPPPPPPTQQPQQQHQPDQSFRYGDDNDYDDDHGDEDVGAMSTAVNIFASTASTIFSRGGAAAKQLAAQGQKAASQLAAAAAPPPIHHPFTSQAYTHKPHPQTQSRSHSVPETSMLETPEMHHKPLLTTMGISPALQVPILAPQTQLIDQPTRHSTTVTGSTRGFPQQNMRQRPPSPAEAFFGAESPALAPQWNAHYAPPPFPQPHPAMPDLSANQPPVTSTMVSSHSFEPPMRVSPQPSFHLLPTTTASMEHVSGPPPIAAQFFAASAPVPVTSAPCIELIDSTPVLTNQQPPIASHIALPPPQQPSRSDSSRIAPQFFPAEASVPASQPPLPAAKTQPHVDPPSNAPSQPHFVQANVLQPALIAVSAPASSAFPPPRPNPVSRLTPPSSPMSATSNRTLNFPLPRRTPVVLPRPKLPSPRTSPGGSSKFGIFKLPTPAKKLPLPRPVIQRPTPVVSEEFDVSPAFGQEHARQSMAPLSDQEPSYQETKHEAKATSYMQGAATEPTKTVTLLVSGIEPEEAYAVREESASHTFESEAISVPLHAVQELEILPELPSVPSQPDSALNPPVATDSSRIDLAEVSGLPDPRLDAQEELIAAISKYVEDVSTGAPTEALEQHDPNTDWNKHLNSTTGEATWELPALRDPALVAEVKAASDVGGDDGADTVEACLLPPLERGDETPGEIVRGGGQSDLDMDVADPGELKQYCASSKEARLLDTTTEVLSYDNVCSGEASRKGRAFNVIASVPDAGANTRMEGLNRRHELGTGDDALLENTGSSVVEVLPQAANPLNDGTLPEGWSSQQDPATGNIYFYNSLTLETTWNRPFRIDFARNEVENLGRIDVVDQPNAPPEDSISVAAGKRGADVGELVDIDDQPPLCEDWTEIRDPTTGDIHYYNPTTEATSWIKPVTRGQHSKGDDATRLGSARGLGCPSGEEMLASDVDEDDEETDSQSEESLDATKEAAEERTLRFETFVISEPQSSTELPLESSLSTGTVSEPDAPSGDHPRRNTSTKDVTSGMRSVEASESARPGCAITEVCEVRSETGMVGTPVSECMEPDGTALPEGWTELLDPTSGQPYYFCSLTNETTWDRPNSGVGLQEPLQSNSAESEEDRLALDENETPYVLNEDTAVLGDSSRDDPETEIAEEEDVVAPHLSNQLPSGWASGVDPSSGMTFYFNGETGETSWDTPVDMSLAEGAILPATTDLAGRAREAETTPEFTSKDSLEAEPESTTPNLLPRVTVEVGEESARHVDGSGDLYENLEQEIVPRDTVHSPTLFIELSNSPSDMLPAERVHLDEDVSAPTFGENNVLVDEQRFTMGRVSDNLRTPGTRSLQDGDMEKPVLPNPWIEETDANSGQSYFFNPETLESTWERPSAGVIEEHNAHGNTSCAEEQGIVEDRSEVVVPDGSENDVIVMPDGDGALDSTPVLKPSEWTELVDPTSGRVYFYRAVTGETSWERPHDDMFIVQTEGPLDSSVSDEQVPIDGFVRPKGTHVHEISTEEHQVAENAGRPDYAIVSERLPFDGLVPSTSSLVGDSAECIDEPQGVTIVAHEKSTLPLNTSTVAFDADVQNDQAGNENPELQVEVLDEPVLPLDWVASVDPTTGNRFYFNVVTSESTWDHPVTTRNDATCENPEAMASSDLKFPEETELTMSDCHESEERGFERHAHFRETESEPEPSMIPVSEVALEGLVDLPETGLEPIEMRASDPDASGTLVNPSLDTDVFQFVDSESILPEGWVEVVDPASGLPYFFCEATNETSWERPIVNPSAARLLGHDVSEPPIDAVQDGKPQDHGETSSGGRGFERHAHFRETESEPEPSMIPVSEVALEGLVDLPETGLEPIEMRASDPDASGTLVNPSLDTDVFQFVDSESILPEGWVEVVDPASGLPYFFCEATNETSWERPIVNPSAARLLGHDVSEPPIDAVQDGKPQDHGEPSSEGRGFERHAHFRETESEPEPSAIPVSERVIEGLVDLPETGLEPIEMRASDPDASGTLVNPSLDTDAFQFVNSEVILLGGWVEVVDPASGLPYFFCEATNETSWERPIVNPSAARLLGHDVSEPPIDEVQDGKPQDHGEKSSASLVLPPGWVALVDPTTGNPYYCNVERNITLWEVPVEDEPGHDVTSENVLTSAPTPDDVSSPASCDDADAYSDLHDGWVEVDKHPSKQAFYPSVIEDIAPSERFSHSSVETIAPTLAEVPSEQAFYPSVIEDIAPSERLSHSSVETTAATPVEVNSESESTAVEESPCYEEVAAINNTAGDAGVVVNAEGELLEGWVDLVDIPSGKHYYFNEASGSTTWSRPVRMPRSLDFVTTSTTPRKFEPKSSHDSLPPLPKGWIAVEDPNSGGTYYVNEIENRTTWERPQTVVGSMAGEMTNNRTGLKNGSSCAFASFGFGGRLCIFRASSRPRTVEMHAVCDLVPSHPVVIAEKAKRRFGIVGALNDADSAAVESYIEANAIERTSEFLWSLIQIASRSEGRLRSDEGVTDVSSPESSIIQLLLQAESSHDDSGDRYHNTSGNDVASSRASLHSIESLLLHGKREEAVQEAIASQQFAMALLIASMCDRSTFQHATKQFAEEIASRGSPLYTLALLFSGQLEPPPDSALEMSGLVPTVWSDSTEELRQTWKHHLCAIVSNRILGWDRIVLSLGDRLLELGDVHAAHCCYMVCGCPVASIVHPSSRMSLVGCDHLVPLDAALMTDAGIAAFCRSEAYEWAKRRGNPEAVINSLQGFKLAYAMILADLGYNDDAMKYVKSIRHCMGLGSGSNDDCLLKKSAPTVWELADTSGLLRFINEFDERLSFQRRPHGLGPRREALVSMENAPSTSIITMPAHSADASLSFLSTTSHGLDGEEPAHTTQRSATKRSTTNVARRKAHRNRLEVSKPSLVGSRSLKEPPAPSPSKAISPSGLFPSAINSSSPGLHAASFRRASVADDPPTMILGSKDTQQPETIMAGVGDETIAARRSNAEGPPKVAVPLLALHDSRAQIKVGMDKSTGIAPATVLRDPVSTPSPIPTSYTQETKPEAPAPSLPPKKALESRSPQKTKNLVKAPSSAPAELQRAAKTSVREPTSAQKRAWGLGGFRDQMTKWLNPNATTADLGGGMEAYYDEDKKVWVFPGEDPAALAAPIGPPPMATTPALEVKKEEANNEAPPDPLAAMMAPPPRSISSLRRLPVAPLSVAGLPTGMMLPPGARSTAAPTTPAAGPPKFMVFTPKAGQTQQEGNL